MNAACLWSAKSTCSEKESGWTELQGALNIQQTTANTTHQLIIIYIIYLVTKSTLPLSEQKRSVFFTFFAAPFSD
jgi:hypothetical protein